MATDLFINIDGIKGESGDTKYKDAIDVLSWAWGATQPGTSGVGGGSGAGKVQVQDFTFTKYIDKASPLLFEQCCSGKHIKMATFVARKAGEKPLEYLTIKLENALISSYNVSGAHGGDQFMETVTLNFASAKMAYTPQVTGGSGGAAVETGWDIVGNKKA